MGENSTAVRVAIVGVGNCASSLVQGVHYYKDADETQTVPGLMLIVPGSVGFGSVASFLNSNVFTGVEAAFRMSMIVVSLVTGLLLANAVVQPKNEL